MTIVSTPTYMDLGLGELEAPEEELLEKRSKEPDTIPGKRFQDPLDRVRGERSLLGGLDHPPHYRDLP